MLTVVADKPSCMGVLSGARDCATLESPAGSCRKERFRMSRIVSTMLAVAILVAVPFLTAAPTWAADDANGVEPIWIYIPAIDIEANIEEVEIDDGVMGEPEDPWAVGWYPDLGYLPEESEDQQIVMAGHVDWWGYGPTVFADLQDLEKDDEIVVGGEDGWTYIYAVTDTWTVDEYSEPKDVWRVFHPSSKEKDKDVLTLITCTGAFDGEEYAARFVVRAELIDTEPTETE
jgi:LPXTG-site transpeptidase (sortase) family protein